MRIRCFPAVPVILALLTGIFLRVFVFDIFRVEGRSMEPAIKSENILLVSRAAYGLRNPLAEGYLLRWSTPRVQELIVYRDPRDGEFRIKRCAAVSDLGVVLRGDNSGDSVDSRLYGSVPVERIIGKVLICF
ncbi:MAG: signal peptidase I [Spirochaetales bacterium]|jgi:signal peptidase I|nr:signal peptidase I [Spirochaetales bacterium]